MILKKISGAFLFAMIIVAPFIVRAVSNDLSLEATPQEPGAHETVQLRLLSYGVDLSRSEIFWYVNDVLGGSGIGLATFRFETGSLGTKSKIDVLAKTPAGSRFSQSITFRPAEVDIIWSAHTYTPPFYKGRRLASSESLLRINAVSQFVDSRGKKVSPSNLLYAWEQDGVALGRVSGVGKDSVVLRTLPVRLSKTYVTVTVSSLDTLLHAERTVAIQTANPFLIFYEKHPLEGVRYEKTLTEFEPKVEEFTVRAEPYFFSLDDIQNGQLEYQWSVNGQSVNQTESNPRELTLRRETETSGTASVKLKTENISRILQLAENILYVNL